MDGMVCAMGAPRAHRQCHSLNHFTPSKPLNIQNYVTVSWMVYVP